MFNMALIEYVQKIYNKYEKHAKPMAKTDEEQAHLNRLHLIAPHTVIFASRVNSS
jgi:transaldolase